MREKAGPGPRQDGDAGRQTVGSIWLQQRPKAWLWVAAFLLVVLVAVVVLFGLDLEPVATG